MLPRSTASQPLPDAGALRRTFDRADALTIGLEEEVMLLDPETLDLAPAAPAVLGRLDAPERFKPELPLSQLEIVTAPHESAADAAAELATGRRELIAATERLALPAAAGTHPFADPLGELNPTARYGGIRKEYASVARLQLVSSLQVHVAVGGAERSLAVYNALRSHLPELAALAANAPLLAGLDTRLASVRPKLAELLPRQGVPPTLSSWDEYAEAIAWGARCGAFDGPRHWWWELRPHPGFGTLEVRVCDAQSGLAEVGAVAAVVQALVAWLAAGHDAGDLPAPAPAWRIEQNRWSACRHGVSGTLADLRTGRPQSTRARLERLFDQIGPAAARLGVGDGLDHARRMLEQPGYERQRRAFQAGPAAVAASLVDRYREGLAT